MPSSIFNFDLPRAAWRWPARRHLRHAALLAGFVATYLACLGVMDAVFGKTRPETTRTLAVKALSERTEILFLGNSVVEAAIDSTLYPRPVMALPMANGNYEVDEMILNRHLPALTGLKTVVFQLDVTCLGWDRLGITLDYSAFHELGIPLNTVPRPAWWRWRQSVVEHPLVYPMLFGERLTPRQLLWEPIYGGAPVKPEPGYIPLKGVLTEEARAAYLAKTVPAEPLVPDILARNEAALLRMAAILQKRGTGLVLLRYPTRGGYTLFRHPEWEKAFAEFRARVESHPVLQGPQKAKVIDLADDPLFVTSDFRDTVHLNRSGAAKLAQRLGERLR